MPGQFAADVARVRFFLPSPELAPYVSTYYLTEVNVPEGCRVEDWMHPEWANLRFARNDAWEAAIGPEPLRPCSHIIATGPTSMAAHFVTGSMYCWGIGLLPLGWARFVAAPASDFADRFTDGLAEPAFAAFAPLLTSLFSALPDPEAEAARIDAFLRDLLPGHPPAQDEERIRAAHAALVDPALASVTALAERTGMSPRSFERLSLRAFGFSPKLLLRRQRFLRSLGQFMLDPSLTWISTLDWHYHDQAHFVRDFRRFMGMTPKRYAALDKPVLRAAARARAAMTGVPVQGLQPPQMRD